MFYPKKQELCFFEKKMFFGQVFFEKIFTNVLWAKNLLKFYKKISKKNIFFQKVFFFQWINKKLSKKREKEHFLHSFFYYYSIMEILISKIFF